MFAGRPNSNPELRKTPYLFSIDTDWVPSIVYGILPNVVRKLFNALGRVLDRQGSRACSFTICFCSCSEVGHITGWV